MIILPMGGLGFLNRKPVITSIYLTSAVELRICLWRVKPLIQVDNAIFPDFCYA